jgi:hypothetical protein
MKDVAKYMDFEVCTSLYDKSNLYHVTMDLENEVSSQTRECVIALAGAIVRNYHSGMYKDVKNDTELANLLKDKVNAWIPSTPENKLIVLNVNVGPKRVQSRR